MKSKKENKDKFDASKQQTVWLTLDEFAEMIGITMDKPKKKKKKNEKHTK
jgi:hypothetical protein